MRGKRIFLQLISYFVFFLFIFFSSINSFATQSVYTIQTGSFQDISTAEKQFDSIVWKLDKTELKNLRIEKIGNLYSVRIGKFEDQASANKFLRRVKARLKAAIAMKVYYIEGRITKSYKGLPTEEKGIPEEPAIRMTAEDRIQMISGLVDKGDYDRALEIIKQGMVSEQDNPELNGWYGAVLLKKDEPARAIQYFKKASELSPGVTDYHNGSGYSLLYLSRPDEAIDEFNKTLSVDPKNIDAFAGLGVAYANTGEKDKALEVYSRLKGLDGDTADRLFRIIK